MKNLGKLGLAVAILLTSFLSVAGIAYAKSIEESAWQRAKKLANVTKDEAARWKRPPATITGERRYIPTGPTDGSRICGEMRSALVGQRPALRWDVQIFVYARMDEEALIGDALTHEMLHVIYLYRIIEHPEQLPDVPDSESYVISLLPTECTDL